MEQISAHIKDPAWWFSAFFIAIIASVVAGFAKDYIQAALSRFSTRATVRQAERVIRQERVFVALEENGTFLILTMLRATVMLIMMTFSTTLFVLSPMWPEILTTLCSINPGNAGCYEPQKAKMLSFFASVGFGFTAMLTSFSAVTIFSTAMKGYRRYRRKNGLPAVN